MVGDLYAARRSLIVVGYSEGVEAGESMVKFAIVALSLLLFSSLAYAASTVPKRSDLPVGAPLMTQQDRDDDHQCGSYGAKIGSEAYVQCRLKLLEMRQKQTAAQQMPAAPSQHIRCRTIFLGSIARTKCK